MSPGPKLWHADIVERLRHRLKPLELQGFVIANDFGCILGEESILIPDLAAVREERWRATAEGDAWLEGSPELVIEVASPSNRKLYRRSAVFLEHGAEQVWIAYRKTRSVTIWKPDSTTEARMDESLEFHGVTVPVAAIFSRS